MAQKEKETVTKLGGLGYIYTNKIGDCLFIYLFVYLSICSAIGGQTARPKRLKFGG